MNRRGFLLGALAAPAAVVPLSQPTAGVNKTSGIRISRDPADSGYRAYCEAFGDGKKIRVFLNGVEQRYVETADEREGFVLRAVTTDRGNLAHDGHDVLTETVHGDVLVMIEDQLRIKVSLDEQARFKVQVQSHLESHLRNSRARRGR